MVNNERSKPLLMKPAFTLIELLVVMAIIGVLATAVIVAINPNKRLTQARDAQRKTDISAIANALIGYYALTGNYPNETNCDTSIGYKITAGCTPPLTVPLSNWLTTARIYLNLVTDQAFLKNLPKDPTNNNTYYYSYEPRESVVDTFCGVGQPCDYYWIGTLLESPADPLKPIFRCSDYPSSITPGGPGCKEVSDQLSDETPDDI